MKAQSHIHTVRSSFVIIPKKIKNAKHIRYYSITCPPPIHRVSVQDVGGVEWTVEEGRRLGVDGGEGDRVPFVEAKAPRLQHEPVAKRISLGTVGHGLRHFAPPTWLVFAATSVCEANRI